MFGNLLARAGSFMRKAVGRTGGLIKTLGDATGRASKWIGAAAPHVSALATIAGQATNNQTLKDIGSFAGKAGAIAQTAGPNAGQLMKMVGHSMQTYGRFGTFSLTRDTYNPSLYGQTS
jgi:hypothetical protein